jgi:hypothetical protein
MLDSAQQALDASVEDGVSDEKIRLAGGIFTKRQILELEMRHIVGPALHFRSVRLGRKPA